MTWSATFDTAGRMTAEQLAKGTNVIRSFGYSFYPSNSTYAGMLSSVSDPRGITRSYSYDDYLRLAQSRSAGSVSEQNQTNSYTYDKLGHVLQIIQTTGNSSSTTVNRSYDGYGQLYDEQVAINATTISHFTQKWDAAGRRKQLAQTGAGTGGTMDYYYRGDNLLEFVQQGGLTFGYAYDDNGLLRQRSNPLINRYISGRDGMGRPLGIVTTGPGVAPSFETMSYRANSTLSAYTSSRFGLGAWNEGKSFTYNNRGQLTQETLSPMGTANATYTYGFDADKLGVLTSASVSGAVNASWQANSLDAFSRSKTESLSVTNYYLQAKGYAVGAGRVSLTLDGSPLSTYYDASKTNGLWLADMQVGAGSHTLKATATHPFGTYTNSATNTFTVLAKAGTVTNVYDAVGNVTLRSLPGGRAQTLTWDAAGRLLRVQDRNGTNDGYEWTAIYDGLGRRWQTTFQTVTNNVIQTNSPLVTTSWFDPLVEFQELAVSVNGQRTWKVYGPDLNGGYGALQGTGGLEATIRESDGLATGLVNDAFGNVLASLTADGVVWNPTKVNGYGPLPGFEPLVLSTNVTLAEATVWRSKRIDPTGLYWLGARYYDPADARFLSCDPLGLGSDPSLYAAFGGDPVNFFDADGRLVKGAISNYGEMSVRNAEAQMAAAKHFNEKVVPVAAEIAKDTAVAVAVTAFTPNRESMSSEDRYLYAKFVNETVNGALNRNVSADSLEYQTRITMGAQDLMNTGAVPTQRPVFNVPRSAWESPVTRMQIASGKPVLIVKDGIVTGFDGPTMIPVKFNLETGDRVLVPENKLYGPFYRVDPNYNGIKESGTFTGTPARNMYSHDQPSVKLFSTIPENTTYYELYTFVPPDTGQREGAGVGLRWTGPRPGVIVDPYTSATINVQAGKMINRVDKARSSEE
jgi:RHS repeat-associated protein